MTVMIVIILKPLLLLILGATLAASSLLPLSCQMEYINMQEETAVAEEETEDSCGVPCARIEETAKNGVMNDEFDKKDEKNEHNGGDNVTTPEPLPKEEEEEEEEEEDYDDGDDDDDDGDGDDSALPRVGIYSGKGTWEENLLAIENFLEHYGFEWTHFDHDDIASLTLNEHFDLAWFPGGFSAEYRFGIADHDKIYSYVEKGGMFVGFCAGAYYASETMSWKGTESDYPLGLFKGKSVGPLVGLVNWGDRALLKLDSNHPAADGHESSMKVSYYDGPYFVPRSEETVEVLARYDVNGQPAVIAGRVGEGKYLLFGPHPELGSYSPGDPHVNLEGSGGARWPWLFDTIKWLQKW